MSDNEIARQIASLLNERNQLLHVYTTEEIEEELDTYEYEVSDGKVIACVQRKKVQWYQWEICHLSVLQAFEGKGHASHVYRLAEDFAKKQHVRLLQCTIREGNAESAQFFDRKGYVKTSRFLNRGNSNIVGVWQKVLELP